MQVALRPIALPEFGVPQDLPAIPEQEYEARARALYAAAGTGWVVVYGDREHAANLTFFSGFDPRFEEAMLLLGPRDRRVLVVGNEGMVHVQVAGLPAEVVLYQPFSLMGQPRGDSPPLVELLREVGLGRGARVGVVGWKYLASGETDDPTAPGFVPAFLTRAIGQVTSIPPVDTTATVMNPSDGLRNVNSAAQIVRFEWGAARSSAAVMRVVRGTRPGMTELEAIGAMGYAGEPQSCHPILATSTGALNGLRSPSARTIARGDAASVGIGYWGGLTCRAGLVTGEPDDDFLAAVVRPYFGAVASWWETIGVGVTGGAVEAAVMSALSGASFRPMLNPGHLISYDEWVHSPMRPGSVEALTSGMVLQCDIIPTPLPPGRALNCEDTAALADRALRDQLAQDHPAVWARIEARRAFMRDQLGLRLRPEVLPLSSAPAYLPPFWLEDRLVCTVRA